MNCEKCNNIVCVNINSNNFYFFCNKCIKSLKLCSKSNCKKLFMLNDSDLVNLKIIYLNSNYNFYLYDDVYKIILTKYGSLDNLEYLIKNKRKKCNNIKVEREKILKEQLMLNKLEYKNYGDCYSYVNYGKPPIEQVLVNELEKLYEKNKRRLNLASELSKINMTLDETIKPCYEYINDLIPEKSIDDIVKKIQFETKNNLVINFCK